MAEKSAKKKPKKAAKTEESVLGNLSLTRPTRLGGDRRTAARGASAAAAKTTAATKPASPTRAAMKSSAAKASSPKTGASAPKQADAKAAKLRKPAPAPPAGWQAPDDANGRRKSGPPRGTEIVTTAAQAAAELAQIGATVGRQLLKRASRRIPRP
jgi:hypothetical protein